MQVFGRRCGILLLAPTELKGCAYKCSNLQNATFHKVEEVVRKPNTRIFFFAWLMMYGSSNKNAGTTKCSISQGRPNTRMFDLLLIGRWCIICCTFSVLTAKKNILRRGFDLLLLDIARPSSSNKFQ